MGVGSSWRHPAARALPSVSGAMAGQQALTQFAVRSHFPQRELESTFSGPGGAGVVLLQFQFNQVMLRKPGYSEKHTLKNRKVILQPQVGR